MTDQSRAEMVERVSAKLLPHLDTRCHSCAGTGVSIRSNLDCTPCCGSGIRSGLASEWVSSLASEIINLVSAGQLLARMDDAAEVQPVIAAATKLCEDSLGDDQLWSATTSLRGALATWNISDRDGEQP